MKNDFKRKIYIFVAIFIALMLALAISIFIINRKLVLNHQHQTNYVVERQIKYLGHSIHDHVLSFKHELRYLVSSEDFSVLLKTNSIDNESYRSLKLFFEKYSDILDNISIYDKNYRSRKITRNKYNYYFISDIRTESYDYIFKEKPKTYNVDFHISYLLPILNANGEVILNMVAKINLPKFIQQELMQQYSGKSSWNWFLHPSTRNMEVFYAEEGMVDIDSFKPGKIDFISEQIKQGYQGAVAHNIDFRNKSISVLSNYYPVKLFGETYGLFISLPISNIEKPINTPILYLSVIYMVALLIFSAMFIYILQLIKSSNRSLQKSEFLIKRIIDTIPVGVAVINQNKIVTRVNNELYKIFGLDPNNDIIGKHCKNSICFDDSSKCPVLDQNTNVRNLKKIITRPDETEIPVIKSAEEISFGNEDLVVETFVDISEQESALRKARIAHEAKSQFLSNISHEIRTPMNGIIGFANLLQNENLAPVQREYVNYIMDSSQRLMNVIDDILNFSKLESGSTQKQVHEINIYQLIEPIISNLKKNAQDKSIALDYYVTPNLKNHFLSDKTKLSKMLEELLANAIKFTSTGSVNLRVSYLDNIYGNNRIDLKFEVSDTGIGIPKDKLDLIFEKFTQADGSMNRHYNGTGLGLAMVKSLAQKLNTAVKVESVENKGSIFSFTINVQLSETLLVTTKETETKSINTERQTIVIGSQDSNLNFDDIDEDKNIEVFTYESGLEVINYLNTFSKNISTIILDENLAEMSGTEVYHFVSSQPDWNDIHVILHAVGNSNLQQNEQLTIYNQKKDSKWIESYIQSKIKGGE
jgi:PAS domain S-box-containing protein